MKKIALLFTLCSWPVLAQSRVAICALFDLSQSAQSVRTGYLGDFDKVLGQASEGVLLLGTGITADSLATGRFEINSEIPKFNPFLDNRLNFRKKLERAQAAAREQARSLLQSPSTASTDLLGGMQLAGKALEGDAARAAKSRVLILFSDMIEESDRYNFQRDDLTERRIAAIIAQEKNAGHLPSLNGVTVWVAGAGGQSRSKYLQIQDFWLKYFQAAGADLRSSHYGAALMDFSIPHSE